MAGLIFFTACFIIIILFVDYSRRFSSKIPHYKSEGSLAFLIDAKDYAVNPIELIKTATAKCGDVFSVQVFTLFNVFLRGNKLNKFYLETREDAWSFAGGMVRDSPDPRSWLASNTVNRVTF